jgi:hypothetical protein
VVPAIPPPAPSNSYYADLIHCEAKVKVHALHEDSGSQRLGRRLERCRPEKEILLRRRRILRLVLCNSLYCLLDSSIYPTYLSVDLVLILYVWNRSMEYFVKTI